MKNKSVRILGIALTALAAATAIAGCGGGTSTTGSSSTSARPKYGGTLRVAEISEIATLNMVEINSFPLSGVFEPLIRTNSKSELEPWLASSWTSSDDAKTWTINVRPGVKFSDGKPLTAADVVFSLKYAFTQPYYEPYKETVASVEEKAPMTVVIKNKKPAPEFPAEFLALTGVVMVQNNFGGESAKDYFEHPIGTGPFTIESWKRGQSLTMTKNPTYWKKGFPYLSKIVYVSAPEDTSRVSQLRDGELNVIQSPPWAQVETINNTPGLQVGEYPLGLTSFLTLNSRKPLFKDPRVREAVKLAIDREAIVTAALAGNGKPAGSWIPPIVPDHDSSIKPPEQNIAKAKSLLAEVIAETHIKPSFTIDSQAGVAMWTTASAILQSDLDEVGFEVKLQPTELGTLLEVQTSGEFDAIGTEVYSGAPTVRELFGYFVATEGLGSGALSPKMSSLMEAGTTTLDAGKRRQYNEEVQKQIDKEDFLLPLTYIPYSWALQENVSGFEVSGTGWPWMFDTGYSSEG